MILWLATYNKKQTVLQAEDDKGFEFEAFCGDFYDNPVMMIREFKTGKISIQEVADLFTTIIKAAEHMRTNHLSRYEVETQ